MYTNVSEEFKEIVKSNSITASAKIYFPSLDLWIAAKSDENVNSSLVDLVITDNCYDDGKLLGTTMSKEVELKIINKDNLDLADEEFELYVGVKLSNGDYEYVPYGTFIINFYEDTKSNNIYRLLAYDYMIKLNDKFNDYVKTQDIQIIQGKDYYVLVEKSGDYIFVLVENPIIEDIDKYYEEKFVPTYPISLKDFREQLLTSLGIEFEEQDLANDAFVINNKIDFSGYTNRNVIAKIAELQGCFAKFNRDNKLQLYPLTAQKNSYYQNETLIVLDDTVDEANETLNCNEYFSVELNEDNDYDLIITPKDNVDYIDAKSMNSKLVINKKYGPINMVSFTMKNIVGENVTLKDETSIALNGETTIEIQDNPFVYTQGLKESAITELFNMVNGFSYIPTEFQYKARLYLDGGDNINVYNVENDEYVNSIVLNQTIKLPTTRQSIMKNDALTKTQVLRPYISQNEQKGNHTEILVDKQEQRIQSLIRQVGDRTDKTTSLTQDVDGINASVVHIADLTVEKDGYYNLSFENINQCEPVYINIYPLEQDIASLYPSNVLYPSNTLYSMPRKIIFRNTTLNKTYEYQLPSDLLYLGAIHDEFILDYESHVCKVIKRIGRDENGEKYVLDIEREINYEYPKIQLDEGDYIIEIPYYTEVYKKVRLMKINQYTSQFATTAKVEGELSLKVGVNENNKIVSMLNAAADEINLKGGSRIILNTERTIINNRW